MNQPQPNQNELISLLEDAQLASAKTQPLPRRPLKGATLAVLIALRVYVIFAIPVVGYAFIHALALGGK